MKHTPAPWIYRTVPSDSVDGKTSYWIDTVNAAPLADVRTRPDNEHEANARLIAAAPELLEALINLVEDVEFAQPQIESGLIGNRQIKKARLAIEKATS